MYQEGGYQAGAREDRNAPYNQSDVKLEEIEVDIIVTMSLRTKIKVDDYDVYEDFDDDEGRIIVKDFENCNLLKHVKEQVRLPMEEMYEFKDWTIDDYQVFLT